MISDLNTNILHINEDHINHIIIDFSLNKKKFLKNYIEHISP